MAGGTAMTRLCLSAIVFIFAILATNVGRAIAEPGASEVAAYRALIAQDIRLAAIGHRLATANAPYCKVKERNPGWVIHDIAQYPDADTANTAFGFAAPIQIAAVVPGAAADTTGLRAGDGFTGLDDATIYWPAMPVGKSGYGRMKSFKQLLSERWAKQDNLRVKVLRGGKELDFMLNMQPVCASDFQIDPSPHVDAGAQGSMVSVTSALAEFASNEIELAAVVAHEFSHNILQHRVRLDAAKVSRGFGRQFGKSRKAILASEIEADRLSIWLLANAGYDLDAALAFWQRYAQKHGAGILSDGTHPGWTKRIAMMRAEAAQIAATQPVNGTRAPPLLSEKVIGPASSR
jgi:hypothetical protein